VTTFKIKILGAGSIGNHLSNAARTLGWSVDLVDTDPRALERTRTQIYPGRYGKWDESIRLFEAGKAPVGGYDLIFIGTPPDVHVPLALQALSEKPRALLIEKPVCGPGLESANELFQRARREGVAAFVGYDHVIGRATRIASELASKEELGPVTTLDVEFREHWGGIFGAHPWLAGPWETYLGFWPRGGGASGEHSHAANLWQHFAHVVGAGRVVEVQATLDMVKDERVNYDRLCLMNLRTEQGLIGRCVQDVVTQPPRKWARVQRTHGFVEWQCGREPGVDVVTAALPGRVAVEQKVTKTRPDDFIEELRHIETALGANPAESPIALSRGLDTMLVVAAAHLSHQTGKRVKIDYSRGYDIAALEAV
jgi:predicted dehydrogenase